MFRRSRGDRIFVFDDSDHPEGYTTLWGTTGGTIPGGFPKSPLLTPTDTAAIQLQMLRDTSAKSTDKATAALEDDWLAWGILNGGQVYDDGPMCGNYMVCIVGDLPTGTQGNAITIGRVVVFDALEPSAWWQFHEYGHVVDQLDVGADVFLRDYGKEASFAKVTGLDEHDGSVLEMLSNARAEIANKEYLASGTVPLEIFEVSAYGAGYEPVQGDMEQWLVWWVQLGDAQGHNEARTRSMLAQMN